MAIIRKKRGVALAASIVGIFLIGFYCMGTLVAIITLILIDVGKKHFNKRLSRRIFPLMCMCLKY